MTTRPRRKPSPSSPQRTPPWPWAFVGSRGREFASFNLSDAEARRWLRSFAWAGQHPWRRRRVISRLVRHLFPFRFAYWWSGDPYAAFMGMPPTHQDAALADLFQRAGYAFPPPPPEATP